VITYVFQVGAANVQLCASQACLSAAYVTAPPSELKLVLQDSYLQVVITSLTITVP
jgi:hypothetical protein